MNDPRKYIVSTDRIFSKEAAVASKNKTIGQFVDWILINKPKVSIVGIDTNSGNVSVPLRIQLTGTW